jgi:FtsZ-binding cell division protein ZapB
LLQEENNLLKKNNEDLLFEIKNLKAQISALELKNSVNNNLSNFDEEEIEMLRGKVEGFEKLFSFYFK